MNTPLIVWSCISGLFLLILLVRLCHAISFCLKGKNRFISFGSEREEMFIPGDPAPNGIDESDYDCFEDL